jgi:AraC-like DNA-binding protein
VPATRYSTDLTLTGYTGILAIRATVVIDTSRECTDRQDMNIMNSEFEQCSVLANLAILIARAIDHSGFNGRRVLNKAGIDYDFASDPDARLPMQQYYRLWNLAVEESGDPCFGIVVAQNLQPADFHGLGLGMLASETLAAGIHRIARFARCLSLDAKVTLTEMDDRFILTGDPRLLKGREPTMWAFGAGCFVQMCRLTMAEKISPMLVTLPCEEPPCADRLLDYFDCEVRFQEPEVTVVFDRDLLNTRLATHNPRLARANEQVVINYLAEFDRDDVITRARTSIIDALPSGRPSEQSIAETLNMSDRNFRRKLAERDTSFREILDSTRSDLSRQYLEEGERSIAEIAFLLGYSEPTNFARWFRRTAGVTPKEFREQQR